MAARACAQFTRAAGAMPRRHGRLTHCTVTGRVGKMLHCGDAAATAGSAVTGKAVAVSAPS